MRTTKPKHDTIIEVLTHFRDECERVLQWTRTETQPDRLDVNNEWDKLRQLKGEITTALLQASIHLLAQGQPAYKANRMFIELFSEARHSFDAIADNDRLCRLDNLCAVASNCTTVSDALINSLSQHDLDLPCSAYSPDPSNMHLPTLRFNQHKYEVLTSNMRTNSTSGTHLELMLHEDAGPTFFLHCIVPLHGDHSDSPTAITQLKTTETRDGHIWLDSMMTFADGPAVHCLTRTETSEERFVNILQENSPHIKDLCATLKAYDMQRQETSSRNAISGKIGGTASAKVEDAKLRTVLENWKRFKGSRSLEATLNDAIDETRCKTHDKKHGDLYLADYSDTSALKKRLKRLVKIWADDDNMTPAKWWKSLKPPAV